MTELDAGARFDDEVDQDLHWHLPSHVLPSPDEWFEHAPRAMKLGRAIASANYVLFFGGEAKQGAPPSSRARRSDEDVRMLFELYKSAWGQDTKFVSSVHEKSLHMAYQHIIGLGLQAVPLILKSLRDEGGDWFWALTAIVGEDAAAGCESFSDATQAWLRWGAVNELDAAN